MATTKNTLERIKGKLDESMGFRAADSKPQLSPVANPRDVGRRPLRTFGTLEIESVVPDPDQPRTVFDEDEIRQLADSILEKGQLHPIRVRWSAIHGKWIIICGERRYRASRKAGLPTIDCHFVDGEISKTEILEQQLIENLLREDLKPLEEARAFEQLRVHTGWTSKELAEAIRVTPSKVTRSLAILKLPEDILQRVENGTLSARAAYEISRLPDENQMRSALMDAGGAMTRMTIAKAKKQVHQRRGTSAPVTRGIRQSFQSESGLKITVSCKRKGTYEEIEQALQEALDEVRLRIENNVQLA